MWSIAALTKLKNSVRSDSELCKFIIDKVATDESFCKLLVDKIIDNSPDIEIPAQRICNGPFTRVTNRTGWWNAFSNTGGTTNWTQVYNNIGNVAQVVGDWVPVGNAITSPDCVTDMDVDADLGNHVVYMRRARSQMWWDVRLLVNGVVVLTNSADIFHYRDERTDTNPDVVHPIQYHMEPIGHTQMERLNVPASATVQVEARPRYQTSAAQNFNYFRTIVGLYSRTTFTFLPRNIVIGRQ